MAFEELTKNQIFDTKGRIVQLKAILTGAAIAALCLTTRATDITMINGSGIPNDGWTAVTGANGVQLALRARTAYVGGTLPNDGNGNYSATPGFAPPPHGANASWNWDYSALNPQGLGTGDYFLALDTDPSAAFNPFILAAGLYPDNSFGNIGTANGAGTEGLYINHLNDTVMQNSENIKFPPQSLYGLDPTAPGIYDFTFYEVPLGAGPTGQRLVQVNMRVTVGDVAAPDGGATFGLLGAGFAGMVGLRKKLKK